MGQDLSLQVLPLTSRNWGDLEKLFGAKGACAGCWCMYWRLSRKEWEGGKGKRNRGAFRSLVWEGPSPGLLAYASGEPVGWCCLGPRRQFSTLQRSRILKPIDDRPVWSVVCLFVERRYRRRGVGRCLIEAAVRFARDSGAQILEAYPVDPRKPRMPDAFAWTGIASAFLAAGFREVARRSPTRPILRRYLLEVQA